VSAALEELVTRITGLVTKGDRAVDEAEQHYKAAGIHLAECKAQLPPGVGWRKFVAANFSFSRRRADELIRIGAGLTTLAEMRAGTADRVRKARALRNAHSQPAGIDSAWRAATAEQQRKFVLAYRPDLANAAAGGLVAGALQDLQDELAKARAELAVLQWVEPPATDREAFVYAADQAIRLAREHALLEEVDAEMVKRARDASNAWADLHNTLRARLPRPIVVPTPPPPAPACECPVDHYPDIPPFLLRATQ
jgi:hypothetical protein